MASPRAWVLFCVVLKLLLHQKLDGPFLILLCRHEVDPEEREAGPVTGREYRERGCVEGGQGRSMSFSRYF